MISNQLFIEYKTKLVKIKDEKKLEKAYYDIITKCLSSGQFKVYELLFNASVEFNLFFDINKIHDRFSIISKLLLNCIDKVSTGYQTSALGEIIDILRFCNKYSLLERDLSDSEKKSLKNLKKDILFIANLKDLFGSVSNSFIFYIYSIMPLDLYNSLINSSISFFPDQDDLMNFITNFFFNQYTIYGLSVRYLSSIDDFIKEFKKNFPNYDNQFRKKEYLKTSESEKLIEFNISYRYRMFYYGIEEEPEHLVIKKHLVSPKNIMKNIDKIRDKKNYNFYNLSMVLLGGLGPQGLGFTYSTPRGEVLEICSDQKETKAFIIKFKQYLKKKFLIKLERELENFSINENVKYEIIEFLSDILNQKEYINYSKKDSIMKKIKIFLEQLKEFEEDNRINLQKLINKIANAISIILRRIELRDQFKTRMDLVIKDKIKSEDVAKLTSLKGKSHYDVLCERFFFQNIVKRFYEIYKKNKLL
ncbi:MAG: hypothetical protein ACFFC3_00895 [Candidatus Odinarchaeota archaeon]